MDCLFLKVLVKRDWSSLEKLLDSFCGCDADVEKVDDLASLSSPVQISTSLREEVDEYFNLYSLFRRGEAVMGELVAAHSCS